MILRNNQYLLLLASVVFIISCSSVVNTKQTATKKFHVQPVNLYIKGIEKDSLMKAFFYDAFTKYEIELITSEEMQRLAEVEMKRVSQKVFAKDSRVKGIDNIKSEMSKEHKYVSNNLTITLQLEEKEDSLIIVKAMWSNFPFRQI